MSRLTALRRADSLSFPRVSGDEPISVTYTKGTG